MNPSYYCSSLKLAHVFACSSCGSQHTETKTSPGLEVSAVTDEGAKAICPKTGQEIYLEWNVGYGPNDKDHHQPSHKVQVKDLTVSEWIITFFENEGVHEIPHDITRKKLESYKGIGEVGASEVLEALQV